MKVNVIMVFNNSEDKILMCLRAKNPYKGLYNLVGGKVEVNELAIDAVYRELYEETGISKKEIELFHLMDSEYYLSGTTLQVFVGKLNKDMQLVEEVNQLFWMDITENFYDINKFAGEGNIGHMLAQVMLYKKQIF